MWRDWLEARARSVADGQRDATPVLQLWIERHGSLEGLPPGTYQTSMLFVPKGKGK
jgi:hypothetical protein